MTFNSSYWLLRAVYLLLRIAQNGAGSADDLKAARALADEAAATDWLRPIIGEAPALESAGNDAGACFEISPFYCQNCQRVPVLVRGSMCADCLNLAARSAGRLTVEKRNS